MSAGAVSTRTLPEGDARSFGFREPFVFATGIECSYPTIQARDGSLRRVDELEKCFHYERWRDDLALVAELGTSALRYGPPYYRMHVGPGTYDWSFSDEVFAELRTLDVTPVVDLCHFGVPDWIGNFQNPDWPHHFAEFAAAFARRYPWIRHYTPVNEIFVAAKLSGLYGMWNERLQTERGFVTALKHLSAANLMAVDAILRQRPDAWFIQSESAEFFHQGSQDEACRRVADFENQRRFLPFDLLFAHPVRDDIREYLTSSGMRDDEYAWFMNQRLGERLVMGNDFYRRNEQIVLPDVGARPAGDIFGWYLVTRDYLDRYQRPTMHTETNNIGGGESEAPRWLWRQFLNVWRMRREGLPVLGFTWYSLTDQMDWDVGLGDERNVVNPIGLFDLDRRARPVGDAYRELIAAFGDETHMERLVAAAAVGAMGERAS